MLERMLGELCGLDGFKINLNADVYTLEVKVALTAKNNFDDVGLMLHRVCPANLILTTALLYNTWGLINELSWGQLKNKTWGDIKEEVL
jgi:hypothetical protein